MTPLQLRALIRTIPDFPLPGIQFLDISPLLASATALSFLLTELGANIHWSEIDVVIGIESRGFILGAALAARFGKGFVPCRKAGKLPPPVLSESFALEYGKATLEMHPGKGRALLVDDVLATGGTLQAALNIAGDAGYSVLQTLVLINIEKLNSLSLPEKKITALFQF